MPVCTAPEHREVPTPRGFVVENGQWRLEAEVYGEFVASVTGITPPVDTADACYQVGTRLEGFIEQRSDLVARFRGVDRRRDSGYRRHELPVDRDV